jgi:hypothetical protein
MKLELIHEATGMLALTKLCPLVTHRERHASFSRVSDARSWVYDMVKER